MTPAGPHSGFTLLELSIVLIIIALIVAMGSITSNVIASATRTSTNKKLDQLEASLMAFRTANNRLPCPADATLPETNVNFGVEGVNAGACTTGSNYDATTGIRTAAANPGPTANYFDKKHNVAEGAVPFKTLNLPKEFMYDGWGRKFAYAVNHNATAPLAMMGQTLNESCQIAVKDASGNPRTKGAVYALLSYGEDGHGGYLKTGVRNNAGSTNTDELTNCHCDTANAAETTYAASYVGKDATQNPASSTDQFNDLVRFKDRWQLMTYDDQYATSTGPVCQLGFRADGGAGWQSGAQGMFIADVNGDGIDDLIVGGVGGIFVIFGTKSGFPNPLPIGSLDGRNGFAIGPYQYYGLYGKIAVGDVNGDGLADIVIGDYGEVIFGQQCGGNWPNACPTPVEGFTATDGVHGFGYSPYSINTLAVGDINGDGMADIIGDNDAKGKIYALFGMKCGGPFWGSCLPNTNHGYNVGYDLTALADGTHGFSLVSPAGSYGNTYGGAQVVDVNNDGIGDLIWGDYSDPGHSHAFLYVVFGHTGSWSSVNGVTVNGTTLGALPGNLETSFGVHDLNPGGHLIGFTIADVTGTGAKSLLFADDYSNYGSAGQKGSVVIVPLSHITWGSTNYDIESMVQATPPTAYHIDSATGASAYGMGLTVADLNHDGINDIIFSRPYNPSSYGSVYVVYGNSGIMQNRDLALNPLNGTDGFRIDCSYSWDNYHCGLSLASGDINGDGTPDLMISSPYATVNGNANSGYTYVLFGSPKPGHFTNPFPLSTIQ